MIEEPILGVRIVLSNIGTFGDINPLIAIALELKRRGHHPVMAVPAIYEPKITPLGLEYRPVRPNLDPHNTLLAEMPWPKADAELTIDETATVAVQVNGKLRATLSLPRDMAKDAAERAALADDNVQRAIAGKPLRKVIIVPNRIINVVV